MGLFDIFKREKRSEPIGAVTLEELLGGGNKLTVDIAMQVPAVAYCVEMIAGAAAMLPVKLYVKKTDGEIEEITDDRRVKFLNSDTGDTMNADNMRRVWVRDFLLTGSAFGYIESYFGQPSAIKYIPSYAVSVMKKDIDYINKHYTYNVNGGEIFPYRMLKILRNSDGFGKGRGIIQESPLIMETMYQLLKFQKNQVLKGGNKRGFLQSKGVISKDSEENLKRNWANIYSDDMNVNKVMFLNGDVDFKEMSSTSVEMQLNENVKTNDAEIMRLFGTVDGILSPDTVKNAVMPVLDAFEAAFDSDLLLESEKADHYFAFDTKELTRGSVSERYSAYATALQNNFMQLDEVRALEDLPPLGFNYITLGLQNVLVNPSTGEVYTPNTNAVANMNRLGNVSGSDNDGAENRSYFYKKNGKTIFVDTEKSSGGSANTSRKGVDKTPKGDIIETETEFSPLSRDRAVNVLRKDAAEWISTLTMEEKRSIMKYTQNSGDERDKKFYKRLNAMLRGDIPKDDRLLYHSEQISKGVTKFELKHDLVCYRRTNTNHYKNAKPGEIITPKQFISASATKKGSLKGKCSTIILAPKGSKGAYIEKLSKYPKQREVLFDKSCSYKVVSNTDTKMILEVII